MLIKLDFATTVMKKKNFFRAGWAEKKRKKNIFSLGIKVSLN